MGITVRRTIVGLAASVAKTSSSLEALRLARPAELRYARASGQGGVMGRIGWFGVGAMVIAAVAGFAVYSTATAVSVCLNTARDLFDHADAFDRNPPLSVVRIVEREVGRARLADVLSMVLLDRLDCAAGRTDWMTLRPTLSWQLERSFSESERVALFTSTLDTGIGKLGLREGLRKYYGYEGEHDLPPAWPECLIRKAIGRGGACGNTGAPPAVVVH